MENLTEYLKKFSGHYTVMGIFLAMPFILPQKESFILQIISFICILLAIVVQFDFIKKPDLRKMTFSVFIFMIITICLIIAEIVYWIAQYPKFASFFLSCFAGAYPIYFLKKFFSKKLTEEESNKYNRPEENRKNTLALILFIILFFVFMFLVMTLIILLTSWLPEKFCAQ